MEIILLRDVASVGRRGEIVRVSEGYAINLLIPRGLAKTATPTARKEAERRAQSTQKESAATREQLARDLAAIDGKTVTITAKANEHGQLFAAIHAEEVATAIHNDLGVCLAPNLLDISEPIKHTGDTHLTIASEAGEASVTLSIVAAR